MRGLAVGAATLAIGVQAALPQGSAAESRYVGRVVDAANGAAVGGVNVQVVGAGLIQVTDAAGRFRFVGLAAGTYVITARRLGYGERSDSIQVAAADTVTHVLLMSRVPVALSEIVISGKSLRFPQYFEPAYKRLARGRGFFVTREDIAAWTAKDFEAILNRVPGVSANDRGATFQRCQSGLEVLSNPNLKPKVQVWIDGSKTTIGADDPKGVIAVLNSIKPHMVQIVEIYTGVATIPAEFLSDACAVIVIWTKRD